MWYLSIILATGYHFVVQVPRQKPVHATLSALTCFGSLGALITFRFGSSILTFEWQFLALILLFKAVYNAFRLRQFPRSLTWTLSDMTYVFHAAKGDLHYQILSLHQKYGDVVQIQPNHLSFTSVQAIQDIHGFKAIPVKGGLYRNLFQLDGIVKSQNLHSSIDRQYHDKFRRIFGPAFTNSALMGFEPTIQGYLDKMMKSVKSEAKNGSIDITSYSKYFALDVSAKLAFGDTFNTLESDNHRPLLEIMDSMISMSKYLEGIDWIAPLARHAPQTPGIRATQQFLALVVDSIKQSVARGEQSLIGGVQNQMDFDDLVSHGNLFFFAAADTTGNAMAFTLWHTLNCRRAWRKLCDEIRF